MLSVPIIAQQSDLQVTSSLPQIQTLEQSEILSGRILVINNSADTVEYQDRLHLPAGWSSLLPLESSFTLAGGQRHSRIIAVSPPVPVRADTHVVSYVVQQSGVPENARELQVSVIIPPVRAFAIQPGDVPSYVIGGESYDITLHIVNTGNTAMPISLKVDPVPNGDITLQPNRVLVGYNESREVQLTVETDEDIFTQVRQNIHLTATYAGLAEEQLSKSRVFRVNLIPRTPKQYAVYHRMPTEVQLTTAVDRNQVQPQISLSGGGPMTTDGDATLQFTFRGPDARDVRYFNQKERYSVQYEQNRLSVHLGDKVYGLSRLTDRYTYGRGLEISHGIARGRAGLYYNRQLYRSSGANQLGTYLEYPFGDRLLLRGQYFRKQSETAPSVPSEDGQVGSIALASQPWNQTEMEAEFGYGASRNGSGGAAYRFEIRGTLPRNITYNLSRIYAGVAYFGHYEDIVYNRGNVKVPLLKSLQFSTVYHYTKRGLSGDPSIRPISWNENIRPGIIYRFPFGTGLRLEYRHYTQRSAYGPSMTQKSRIRTGSMNLYHRSDRLQLNASGEYGKQFYSRETEQFSRFSINSMFQPWRNQTYGVMWQWGSERYSNLVRRTNSLRAVGQWQVSDRMFLLVNLSRSIYQQTRTFRRSEIYGKAVYRFPNGRAIELTARYVDSQNRSTYAGYVTYSFPLGIPVSRRQEMASLEGVVSNMVPPGPEPMEDVIIDLGIQQAVTGRDGKYVFPTLPPDTYLLRIDQSSLGLNQIPVPQVPMPVKVDSGEVKTLNIGITTAARLSGRVVVETADTTRIREESGQYLLGPDRKGIGPVSDTTWFGVYQVLVEIVQDSVSTSRSTDREGRFYFDEIRPGAWQVRIVEQSIPEGYALKEESTTVNVEPGAEVSVTLQLVPRFRQIEILEQGEF